MFQFRNIPRSKATGIFSFNLPLNLFLLLTFMTKKDRLINIFKKITDFCNKSLNFPVIFVTEYRYVLLFFCKDYGFQ